MKIFKITMGATLFLAFYALQQPQAITAIEKEIAIYDSLHRYDYAHELTPEEMKGMEADRIFEGLKPYKNAKKGGKNNGN